MNIPQKHQNDRYDKIARCSLFKCKVSVFDRVLFQLIEFRIELNVLPHQSNLNLPFDIKFLVIKKQ